MTQGLPDTLDGIANLGIREALFDARTALPARVEKWSPSDQTIDAKPLIKRVRMIDGERLVDEYPVVTKVPVAFLRWGGFVIRAPLQQGDIVLLLVTDRELERWLDAQRPAPAEPRGPRTHAINDAVAIPGIARWSAGDDAASGPIADLDDGDLVIGREDGGGSVRIKPDGAIELGSKDGTKKGIARLDDEVTSDSSTDSVFWAKLQAIDVFLKAAGGAAYGQAGTVLAGALTAYEAVPLPSSQKAKVTSASDESSTE